MMTIPMDNVSIPSSRELVQNLFNKNVELENRRRKSAQARTPSDPSAWQQMRENYEAIILEDYVFSEQHEVPYLLWQLHYRRIEELRAHLNAAIASSGSTTSQGGASPTRPDRIKKIRSHLKTILSEATGFYHDMILKIRAKYGLPLGHFSEDPGNHIVLAKDGKRSIQMRKGMLSCHRCLIYLGDLARYKGLYGEGDSKTRDLAAAESYYLQAASLWPSSGNPHHQLAILASYSEDDFLAVYRYFRSLAVSSPFSTARDNLIIAFEKNRNSYLLLHEDAKASPGKSSPLRKTRKGRRKGESVNQLGDSKVEPPSVQEKRCSMMETFKTFCIRFVRLNGILFTRTSLETFREVFSVLDNDLHELLSTGKEEELNFGSDASDNGLFIVRLIAILIFTIHNVNKESEGQTYAEILQRSVILQNAIGAAFEFEARLLGRCTQLQDPSSSFLLPGILVFVEWLACRLDIAVGSELEDKEDPARSLFWKQCISFFNKLISSGSVVTDDDGDESCFFNMSRYDEGETGNGLALWEDFELRGFLPLVPAHRILDFSRKHSAGCDGSKEKRARVQRILAAGKALVNVIKIDNQEVYFDQRLKKFGIGIEPQRSDDFMLASSSHVSTTVNGTAQENQVEKIMNLGLEQPKAQVYAEVEEDDEVIVFKPAVVEKLIDVISPKLSNYQVLGPSGNSAKSEWPDNVGSISAHLSNVLLQNSKGASNQALSSCANISPQESLPTSSGAVNWHENGHTYLVNGVKNLEVSGNGLVMRDELQGFDSYRPPVSSTYPRSATLAGGTFSNGHSRAPGAVIPSKFDSFMSAGTEPENVTVNQMPAFPTSVKKNPVSRPVRHIGPPPGFSTVRPKPIADGFMSGSELKFEIPPVDNYSWLDGYQLSSSTNSTVPNSTNGLSDVYLHAVSNNNAFSDATSFPFPGKQDPTMQIQNANWKNMQNYQLLGQLRRHEQQQLQLQQVNQLSAPQQERKGQSLWSNNFFV